MSLLKKYNTQATIFALCTSISRAQPGALSVFRISGSRSEEVGSKLRLKKGRLVDRRATLSKLFCPLTGEFLDEVILTFFKGPNSLTGEDVLEISASGGVANAERLHSALSDTGLCREGQPGEFMYRAFLSGRQSLSSVEALTGIIQSENEDDRRRHATSMTKDTLRKETLESWRSMIIDISAQLEICLDFEDVEVNLDNKSLQKPK